MQDNFRKIISIVFVLLLSSILGLVFLNTNLKPKIKDILINGGKVNADIKDQTITVSFLHINNKPDLGTNITINPPTPIGITWEKKDLKIRFKETLLADTEYKLNIKKDNKAVFEDIDFSFKTKSLKLTYLEKSSDSNLVKVVQTDSKFENKKILFQKENIKQYSKNKNYLAVVTLNEKKTNSIYLVNLKDNSIKEVDLPLSLITSISMSQTKDEFAFNRSSPLQRGSDIIPSQEYSLNIFDISKMEYKTINPQNTANYVLTLTYSPDGTALIYQTDASLFYLIDTQSYENVITLGQHDNFGSFNNEKNRIVFNDIVGYSPNLTITNTNRQTDKLTEGEIYPIDPVFMHNSDDIIYSHRIKNTDPSKFTYEIGRIKENNSREIVLTLQNKSLEIPKVSQDDRYIAIERFDLDKKIDAKDFRKIGFQLRPGNADLIIYDLKEEKIIDKGIKGVNAFWEIE